MKKTTEYKLLESEFEDMKSEAARCLLALGAEYPKGVEPATWEGMMAMAEDIQANGKPKHQAAAMFAVAGWIHGCKELKTLKAKQKLEELLESEMAGEKPEGDKPAEEPTGGEKLGIWLSSDDVAKLLSYIETGVLGQN